MRATPPRPGAAWRACPTPGRPPWRAFAARPRRTRPATGPPRRSATPRGGGRWRSGATSRWWPPWAAHSCSPGVGGWIIGSSQPDASGAEARGYEQGQEAGQKAGFAAGKREGVEKGRAAGVKAGKAEGRKTGFAAGRAKGEEEGREAGYSSGYAEGRTTALGGLTPGGWYVLQIGSDANGAVVSGATPVAPGSCYALNGDSVLSGPC